MPKPGEPRPSVLAVHKNLGGLQVFVDWAASVEPAHYGRDADGKLQESLHRDWGVKLPSERLATWVLEHKHGPPVLAQERQRARRLAGELRRAGGFAKDTAPFSEFI